MSDNTNNTVYIQKFFTSRDNFTQGNVDEATANAASYVGQTGRIWWNPTTNALYFSDGVTPGGFAISGGGGGGSPGGANQTVQFNDGSTFGGNSAFTFNKSTGILTLTGNANLGNISTNTINATGNITGNYILGNGSQLTGIAKLNISQSNITGGNITNSISNVTTLRFDTDTGFIVTDLGSGNAVISLGSTFKTWEVTGQPSLVAVGEDEVQFIAGTGMTITTNNSSIPKSITFNSSGSGGSAYGNTLPLGVPADGNLTTNVAYSGWTTASFVTDSLDDLNQVSLNIAGNTFVGNVYITSNVQAGASPTTVAFTGHYIGNPIAYLWNFGDGNTSVLANPSHTYSNTAGGQFTVTYTAYNTNGTFNGNVANGARGSTATSVNTNYITLYTPTPISSFTTNPTSIDTTGNVTITNTSLYATSYSINYGDGNSAVNPGNSWVTDTHTYINSANVDTIRGIILTASSQTSGPSPPYSTTSATTNVKIYTPQSPALTANIVSTINYAATSGGTISFRNDTPGSPGSTSSFGAQQLYNFQWGDGTANSNINIQSGVSGNPGASNITHTFALSAGQQTAGTTVTYTANLWLYTGFSTSPFKSANITITVEPEVRANFLGTANTQSDATGSTAQTGYIYTDYNGNNRAIFSFQNSSQHGNLFNWNFGDSTFSNGITNTNNVNHTYTSTGTYTVALTANGTPGTTFQSNTQTRTSYINIASNPTAPGGLSSKTLSMSTGSQGTSPLLAAGAADNASNIPANGSSVTRYISSVNITSSTISGANTSTTGTLTAYINSIISGSTPFSVGTSNAGTYTNLVVTQDADAHSVISGTYPTGFYKVFSAYVDKALSAINTGYNEYKLGHSTTGNTNTTGFVKDNLSVVPTLSNSSVTMLETTAGTYRYISGVPYYNTGSPIISVNAVTVTNLTGQTYINSATPLSVLSGTNYESTSGSIITTQTKTYAQISGTTSMLTSGIPNANVGISSAYTLSNLAININGSAQAVATLGVNIVNVNGSSATIQLPSKIQIYSTSLSGFNESNIAVSTSLGSVYTDNGVRVSGFGSGSDTPAFSNSTNFYTASAWSGAETMTGTSEAVVRWGTLKHFNSANFSSGYLPIGPDLVTGRSGTQYFTFAFRRATVATFDVTISAPGGIAGLWVAAPGTTIDKSGFSPPTPGNPGPTSTLNGWLVGSQQYNGAGVPGASATGGNPSGTNGCALTGADIIPINSSAIVNVSYTMTLGSQNASNSIGNNILIRIGLNSGQSITALSIGIAT